ncbi:uncharacterized protein RJT21DRAFT_2712 [Scheffersomyces amazonensis]|uniref:uncharacterized protein n=1 Tax=Scheffersomyces amazonensis TaxID=1078765 RepID=UPI00315CA5AB
MSLKESATIDIGFPILGAKFINNKTILITGGGGEGNNGIPNKITAIKCTFKIKDPKRRLQRFREITLPSNEDSPQCLDTARILDDDEDKFSVFVGCNQSSQLIKSMSINNNLRKYVYTKEEHLRFVDAAQLEEEINGDADDYPKIIRLSQNSTIGAFMTSTIPSSIYIFNPETLELNHKFKPTKDIEIKDFQLTPEDDGKTLCYITSSSIETISTFNGNIITSSTTNQSLDKELKKYILSKIHFIDNSNLIIAASLRGGKGAVLLQYSLNSQKILKQRVISKAFNNIVALDISVSQGLIAIAANDYSLTLIKLGNFQLIKSFKKLHPFAITSVSFAPNGSKLATGSAANILHIFRIPPNYSKGKSTIGTIFQYLFTIILVAILGVVLQQAHESGKLDEYIDLGKEFTLKSKDLSSKYGQLGYEYGQLGYEYAQVYGKIGYDKAQEYGKIGYSKAQEYGESGYQFIKQKFNGDNAEGDDSTKHYFTMDEWKEASSSEIFGDDDVYISNEPIPGTETETTSTSDFITLASVSVETKESEYSKPQSTTQDEIQIKEVTKDIKEVTSANPNLDTESFLGDESNYIETSTETSASSASVESSIADTPEIKLETSSSTSEIAETTSSLVISKEEVTTVSESIIESSVVIEEPKVESVEDKLESSIEVERPEEVTQVSEPVASVSEEISSVSSVSIETPVVEPVAQSSAEPVAQSSAEPVTQSSAEPVTQSSAEPVTQSSAEPVTQSSAEPVTQSSAEPVTQSSAEPVTQPSTEPVIEQPVVEAPVVEAPVVEAPVVEAPVVEAPVVEAPVVEAPVVEAPVVEAPVVEAPVVESPVSEPVSVSEPAVESPIEAVIDSAKPIVESSAEPVVEPVKESVAQPIVESSAEPIQAKPPVEEPKIEAPVQEPKINSAVSSQIQYTTTESSETSTVIESSETKAVSSETKAVSSETKAVSSETKTVSSESEAKAVSSETSEISSQDPSSSEPQAPISSSTQKPVASETTQTQPIEHDDPFHKLIGDVSDPSDWKQTKLPVLSELDTLERCYICKEFFKAPVITSCNHTFCSQCIREYLITNNLCPLCKVEVFESNLKRDILLEEIVSCYTRIRPYLFKLLEKMDDKENHNDNSENSSIVNIDSDSAGDSAGAGADNGDRSKRSADDSDDVIEILSEEVKSPSSGSSPDPEVKLKRIKLSPRDTTNDMENMAQCPVCSNSMPIDFLQDNHIEACLNGKVAPLPKPKSAFPMQLLSSSKKKPSSKGGIASFFRKQGSSVDRDSLTPVSNSSNLINVDEPLGHSDFYFKEISKHSSDTKKLPKLDFPSLTTPRLKEKLVAAEIPTTGTRTQLELRYNQYYVLYNSNLDSNHPVSVKILKQRLHQWELSHSAFKSSSGDLFSSRNSLSNKSISSKTFSGKQWATAYQSEFRELIKKARETKKEPKIETPVEEQ